MSLSSSRLRGFAFSLLALATVAGSALADSGVAYTYTTLGQVASIDGPRTDVSDITKYTYDAQGHLTTVTNALGQVTTLANFDTTFGNPQTVTDPNGTVTTLTYAPQGWLASSTVGSSTTTYAYNAVGDVVQIILANGNWIKYTYDDARRLVGVRNRLGESINYTLDAMGNRLTENTKDATGASVRLQKHAFDELGRLLTNVGAASQTQRFGYDLNDNQTSTTTPKSNKTQKSFDAFNRLNKIVDPLGGTTSIAYNAADQITKIVDPRGVTTQYAYDYLGNLTKRVSPDSGTTTFTYDAASNMTSSTDARGVVTNYTYDALNRLTTKTYPATPALNVTYLYDQTANGNKGIGRLTGIQDSAGVLSYTYDAQGNLVGQVRSATVNNAVVNETLGYGYDVANNLTQISYPAGFSVTYTRNNASQVSGIKLAINNGTPTTLASGISYQPFGPLKTLTWGNGLTLTRAYDSDYQLAKQTVGNWQTAYSFDPDGNISQSVHTLWGTVQYQYDALDRLSQEQTSTAKKDYALDATGNRTQRTTTNLSTNTTSDTQTLTYATNSNRLATLNGVAVQHDAAGNQALSNALRYVYDDRGRLTTVYQASTQKIADYSYNTLGQRIVKRTFDPTSQALQGTTTYLYGQSGEALGQTVYNAAGVKTSGQYWFWLDGMPLAQLNANFATSGAISSTKLLYLHSDHLNTPRLATDSTQKLLWSWNSDAYGVGTPNEDVDGDGKATSVALRFPGQIYDASSQLSYNYFRDYNADTGRYVESDPIGLDGGINTYGYVKGNPIGFSDPSGKCVEDACIGESFLVGAAIRWLAPRALGTIGGKMLADSADGDTPKNCPIDPASGDEPDRADLTKAGRAAQKHGDRPGSAFPVATGNAADKNQQGKDLLNDILNSPDRTDVPNRNGGTDVLEGPDGRGARFGSDGKFTGFLEPPRGNR